MHCQTPLDTDPGLQLIEYLPELPRARFACQPFGAAHRAQREAAPRMRIMPQLQHIAVARGAHHVLAFGVTHAVRLDGNVDARPDAEKYFLERNRRA